MDKLKTLGIVFLVCLALGAGWALWMGLKLLAWIAMAGLVVGVVISVAWRAKIGRRLSGPDERSRLT
ncbi:hypothetical protein [uncultured Phenylobacterium sp.]|uniref:hypothetical protein n=1 Tax=uncultured Phenylobacterium sp. TaxID=349273 RepID=UPI0025E5318D|nr:hypothetical protein [uncultured Phenylobacterium sp.]